MAERNVDMGTAIYSDPSLLSPCRSCYLDPIDCGKQYERSEPLDSVWCELNNVPITMGTDVKPESALRGVNLSKYTRPWS